MTRKKPHSGTPTTPNFKRGRPMVTITLSPEGLARLDQMRNGAPRGQYIEGLIVFARGQGIR